MGLKFSNFGKAAVSSAPSGTNGLSFTVEAGRESFERSAQAIISMEFSRMLRAIARS